MSMMRYAVKENATGVALTSALIIDGKDYTFKSIKRVLAAEDVGNGAGQTQHAAGCLVAQFAGSLVKDVVNFSVYRPLAGGDAVGWISLIDGWHNPLDLTHLFKVSWKAAEGSLRLRDFGNNAAVQLVAGDILQFLVVTGNS